MRDWLVSLTKPGLSALESKSFAKPENASPEFSPYPSVGRLASRLATLRGDLKRVASPGDRSAAAIIRGLERLEMHLLKPYRIAVMGEFNTGKSSVANLLVGIPMLPTRAVSNTRVPTLIRYAREPALTAVYDDGRKSIVTSAVKAYRDAVIRLDVGLPVERLRIIEIADLPGVSDPWLQNQRLDVTRLGVHAALWCTLGTQAWKDSERTAWLNLPDPIREHGLLVVTNKDLLKGEDEKRVLTRLNRLASGDFNGIVFLSGPWALAALEPDRPEPDRAALWSASGAEQLEANVETLLRTLVERRLEAIIGAAERMAERALRRLQG